MWPLPAVAKSNSKPGLFLYSSSTSQPICCVMLCSCVSAPQRNCLHFHTHYPREMKALSFPSFQGSNRSWEKGSTLSDITELLAYCGLRTADDRKRKRVRLKSRSLKKAFVLCFSLSFSLSLSLPLCLSLSPSAISLPSCDNNLSNGCTVQKWKAFLSSFLFFPE